MATADLVSRLEAVTVRLEKLAANSGKGGGSQNDGDELPQYVLDIEKVKKEVAPFIQASRDLGIEHIPELAQTSYQNIFDFIKASALCKKPDNQTIMLFLKPSIDAINQADSLKVKGNKKFQDHYKAFYETLSGLQFVTMTPPTGLPYQHVEAQQQATQFNTNRILKSSKDAPDKDKQGAFIKTLTTLNKVLLDYVGEYFKKSGIEWNPKGGDIKNFNPAAVAAPTNTGKPSEPTPQEEEKAAPKGQPKSAVGMDSVFGELSQGLKVTSGLKKVTSDMKTKNRKDKVGLVTEVEPKSKPAKQNNKGPASIQFSGGRWMVENFNDGIHTVEKADIKSNVFISNCDDTVIQIENKVKAITIDSCNKCQIFINEVISTADIVNCKSVTLIVKLKVPAITVEKSSSPKIILLKPAFDAYPDIITSNVSAMNIEIPGVNPNDDPVEIPVPEQYLTKVDPKSRKITTVETKHG